MYIPLHGHSTYSFLEALGSTKQIVSIAKEMGLPSIAITDYSGIYCFPSFYLAAQEKKEETDPTLKAIIGVEL
jgi:DNA polymerase-3 subunit alpha